MRTYSKFSAVFISLSVVTVVFLFGFLKTEAVAIEGEFGQTCNVKTDCRLGLMCSSGLCLQCISSSDCPNSSDICTNDGVCLFAGGANPVGGLCTTNTDCQEPLYCANNGRCNTIGGNISGEVKFGQRCNVNNDCLSGLICVNRLCKQCGTSSNCPSGDICTGSGVCYTNGGNASGEYCTTFSDCRGSMVCRINHCEVVGTAPTPTPSTSPRGSPPASGVGDLPGVDLTIEDVGDIITALACWMLRIATLLMVIFLILAGMRFMSAGSDPTKQTNAKKNFGFVIVGILVIIGTYVIIATVAGAVGVTDFSFIPLVC